MSYPRSYLNLISNIFTFRYLNPKQDFLNLITYLLIDIVKGQAGLPSSPVFKNLLLDCSEVKYYSSEGLLRKIKRPRRDSVKETSSV